jgi:serine/threonine-protein kinase RsbT
LARIRTTCSKRTHRDVASELRLKVATEHDAALSLLKAGKYARSLGFSEQDSKRIVTALSELVRNIIKYAGHGVVVMRTVHRGQDIGMEVEARDRGPGIEDVEKAMTDHFSTGGTLGLGLPGVKRMVDELSVDSAPGKGTTVSFKMWH